MVHGPLSMVGSAGTGHLSITSTSTSTSTNHSALRTPHSALCITLCGEPRYFFSSSNAWFLSIFVMSYGAGSPPRYVWNQSRWAL